MSEFFGGFALKDDLNLFANLLTNFGITLNQYDVCGFGYGSKRALDYVLNCNSRINRLILLSPAFFNNKDSAFLDSQIEYFSKNKELYLKYFYENIGFDGLYRFNSDVSVRDLRAFFEFSFNEVDLFRICNKGIKIIVFLGGKDRIVDSIDAMEFFKNFGIVYFIKEANHLLRIL